MKLLTHSCPRCGCLARGMVEIRKVLLDIHIGRGGTVTTEHKRRVLGRPPESTVEEVTLQCGGGHEWQSHLIKDKDDA